MTILSHKIHDLHEILNLGHVLTSLTVNNEELAISTMVLHILNGEELQRNSTISI